MIFSGQVSLHQSESLANQANCTVYVQNCVRKLQKRLPLATASQSFKYAIALEHHVFVASSATAID